MRNICFTLFLFSYALGWGSTGHRIVGEIAEGHLSEKAKRKISSLMGHHNLAMMSNWADEIKSDPNWKHANDWHYATIPNGEKYIPGKHKGKAIEKVKEFSKVLKNKSESKI